jgi:YD repeat-containing protein
LGHKTTYKLNPIGQVVEVIDARGGTTKYEYDERSLKKTKETTPLGGEITFEYDERGNVVRTTDAVGEETEFKFNALNQPELVKKELGAWAFKFDDRGHLLESQNPCGECTRFVWSDGMLRTVSSPSGDVTVLEYDQWKNLSGAKFADGAHVEYRHDRLGRTVWTNAETGVVT